MTTSVGNIVNRLSGGAANIDPTLSLGGVMSSTPIGSQKVATPIQVLGVTIKFAHNNPTGSGSLKYTLTGSRLSWRPPSSATDYFVSVVGNGEYILGNAIEGFIVVDVNAASLPSGSRTDNLGVTPAVSSLWDTVQPSESLTGSTEYRVSYILNTGDTIAYNTRLWIQQQTTGQDYVEVALSPAGKGNGTSTGVQTSLVDEKDSSLVLSGVVFSAPLSIGTALNLGDLSPNEAYAIIEKRIVPSNTSQQDLNNNYTLAISADI